MVKIAIAGPTGVLGRALIPLLLENGYEVRALARNTAKTKKIFGHSVEICECDLLSPAIAETLPTLLPGCDVVIHIATSIPHDFTDSEAWKVNTLLRTRGTELLLSAALKSGVKQYIQQSIIMAYPDCGSRWITEETKLDHSGERANVCGPIIQMEQQLQRISPDFIHWSILRGGVFVGPGTFQENDIESLRKGQMTAECDGHYYFSPVHVKDMASAFYLAMQRSKPGSVYNINDEPLTRIQYKNQLAELVGTSVPPTNQQLPCPPSHRCSNIKARLELGWQPVHPVYPKL